MPLKASKVSKSEIALFENMAGLCRGMPAKLRVAFSRVSKNQALLLCYYLSPKSTGLRTYNSTTGGPPGISSGPQRVS